MTRDDPRFELLKKAYPWMGEGVLLRNADLLLQPTPAPQISTPNKDLNEPAPFTLSVQDNDSCNGPKPKRRSRSRPLAKSKTETVHSEFYIVRITSFRRRLLDTDNLCGKWHTDSLRYAGILPGDAPDQTKIITGQKKVLTKEEERTEVVIELVDRAMFESLS